MSDTLVSTLLTTYAHANLSAWDNLRVLLSECVLQQCEARGFEVDCNDSRTHYWLQVGDCWLDCGKTNAYSTVIVKLTDEAVSNAKKLNQQECALLSAAQINLLCMQNAHFDHC
ncbi:hypothetical protein [Shewanella sp.]|uniref:hypothetical protein n=1 Tax=Shewanella sp. TaxID=50422 RepID=UPI003A8877C2